MKAGSCRGRGAVDDVSRVVDCKLPDAELAIGAPNMRCVTEAGASDAAGWQPSWVRFEIATGGIMARVHRYTFTASVRFHTSWLRHRSHRRRS